MNAVLEDCREVSMGEIARKSRMRKFSEDICRVFSPVF